MSFNCLQDGKCLVCANEAACHQKYGRAIGANMKCKPFREQARVWSEKVLEEFAKDSRVTLKSKMGDGEA